MDSKTRKLFAKGAVSMFGNIPFIFEDIESDTEKARRIGEEQARRNFGISLKKAQELAPKKEEQIKDKSK